MIKFLFVRCRNHLNSVSFNALTILIYSQSTRQQLVFTPPISIITKPNRDACLHCIHIDCSCGMKHSFVVCFPASAARNIS